MFKKSIIISSLVLFGSSAFAMNGKQVMDKVYKVAKQFKNEKYETEMTVKKGDSKRVSHFQSCTSRVKEADTLISFYKPATLKGTGMLIRKVNGQDDTRLYLPSLRTTRKIEGDDKHKAFMGSDFTNADIIGRELNDDTHKLTKSSDKHYFVTSTPKKKDQYSKMEYKINKKYMIPENVKFYNKSGKLSKTLHTKKLAKVGGKYTVSKSFMQNHITGGSTAISKYNFNVEKSIPSKVFSVPFLKQGKPCM